MSNYLTEDLEYFVDKFGSPVDSLSLERTKIDSLRGRLPEAYLPFLQKYGASTWSGGYFQLLDPTKYQSLVNSVFRDDPDINPVETTAVACSSVGDLVLWNSKYNEIKISFIFLRVLVPSLTKPKPELNHDIAFGTMLNSLDFDAYGGFDNEGKSLFPQLVEKYGALPVGSIYAPRLHPALGGDQSVLNFRPAKAFEALGLMANAGEFSLAAFDKARRFVRIRTIGKQG